VLSSTCFDGRARTVERNRTCYCRCHLHIRCQAPPARDGRKCVHPHSTKRVARRQDPDSANRTGSPTSNGQVPARLEARRDSLHPIEIKPVTCGTAVYRRYISNCGSQHRTPKMTPAQRLCHARSTLTKHMLIAESTGCPLLSPPFQTMEW
jgi:hypothetical protein